MLFYNKRYLGLEIAVTVLLGGLGYWGMRRSGLAFELHVTARTVLLGLAGTLWLTLWTFLVQYGYALGKGKAYARELTASLAKEYAHSGALQILLAGLTAACGEEVFFSGISAASSWFVARFLALHGGPLRQERYSGCQPVVGISRTLSRLVLRLVQESRGPNDRARPV